MRYTQCKYYLGCLAKVVWDTLQYLQCGKGYKDLNIHNHGFKIFKICYICPKDA